MQVHAFRAQAHLVSSDCDSHSRRLSTGTLARNPDIGDQARGFVAAVGPSAGPAQCVERNVIRPSTLVLDRGAIRRPASPLTAGLHAPITTSLHCLRSHAVQYDTVALSGAFLVMRTSGLAHGGGENAAQPLHPQWVAAIGTGKLGR